MALASIARAYNLLGSSTRKQPQISYCSLRNSSRSRYQAKSNAVVFEIMGGAGGVEAMLFADELLSVYLRYFSHMRWSNQILEENKVSLGGVKSTKLIIDGQGCFEGLIQEAGVHRVQRVPKTEKSGRMHTSTASVAVTPKSVVDIMVKDSDLEWQAKRASGPGGQHVNKTESAVRLVHKPSGIAVESQESRFQIDNRKTAMKKLITQLQNRELELITSQNAILRQSQLGNMDRNEKIRTYNFPQDRITDHRINKSYHNLRGLFEGDMKVLERMVLDFREYSSNNFDNK